MSTILQDSRQATEGRTQHRQEELALGIDPHDAANQPDPVSLSEPSFDASGRLRWESAKY